MPSPVSISRSLTSLRRTTLPLRRYCPSPPRKTRRPMTIRPSSAPGNERSVRRVRTHSAIPSGFRLSEPLKMTSSMVPPRRLLALCSPSTQVIASERLLLPQPLGPTMAVTPPAKRTSTESTKDLKPEIWRRSTFSMGYLRGVVLATESSLAEGAGGHKWMGWGRGTPLDVAFFTSSCYEAAMRLALGFLLPVCGLGLTASVLGRTVAGWSRLGIGLAGRLERWAVSAALGLGLIAHLLLLLGLAHLLRPLPVLMLAGVIHGLGIWGSRSVGPHLPGPLLPASPPSPGRRGRRSAESG